MFTTSRSIAQVLYVIFHKTFSKTQCFSHAVRFDCVSFIKNDYVGRPYFPYFFPLPIRVKVPFNLEEWQKRPELMTWVLLAVKYGLALEIRADSAFSEEHYSVGWGACKTFPHKRFQKKKEKRERERTRLGKKEASFIIGCADVLNLTVTSKSVG